MKINGYFNYLFKPAVPFIEAVLIIENFNIQKKIRFLIDTGASSTILLDNDINIIGLELNNLKKADKQITGIGGNIDTYLIEDAVIIFDSDEGDIYHKILRNYSGG